MKDEVGDLKDYLIPITDFVTQAELSVGKHGVHFEWLMRFYEMKLFNVEDIKTEQQKFETREIDLLQVMVEKVEIDKSIMKLKYAFEHGLREYRNQAWDKAVLHFKSCLKRRPEDGPSKLYIKRIQEFRKSPQDKEWSGVWHLTKK